VITKILFFLSGSAIEVPVGDGAASYNSEKISHTTRRQMYIATAKSRMECTEVHSIYQFDGSHESFDTTDNEGYFTDTSFIDQVILDFVLIKTYLFYLIQSIPYRLLGM
jgi:hypothetical protein